MTAWIPNQQASSASPIGRSTLVRTCSVLFLLLAFASTRLPAQDPSNSEMRSGEIRTLPSADSDRIGLSTSRNIPPSSPKSPAQDDSCLLPPLNLATAPAVSAQQLQVPATARKEYQQACAALKNKKAADAEKHLRKAVQAYPKYAAAWVTLGQVLAAQQRPDEARAACSQGSLADSRYVPAYLCLADLALRAHDWNEVLRLSSRALEIDPSSSAVPYEYHAAANLNLHNLNDAEKSGLRAVEIDTNHREPRVHFVLAQIYEAKGDKAKEASQLREFLKYATNPDDVVMVKQSLAELEKETAH